MSEYIGSRISLISKSDIKYIGTLHEINSETHTVALESVTSYGTEGRKGNPAEEIPGNDQVFEYIVFRGSDVKDLVILAPPEEGERKENERPRVPDDPAILGSARPLPQTQQQQPPPPSQNQFRGPPPQQPPYPQQHPQFGYQQPPPNQFPSQPRFQGPGGPHGFPGQPGAVPSYGMGFGPPPPQGFYPPPPGQGFPPQNFSQNQQMPIGAPGHPMSQQRPPQQMPGQQQPGSKQGTPQPQGSQGPTPAPPTQPKAAELPTAPASIPGSAGVPPPPIDSKPPISAATAPSAPAQAPQPAPRAAPKTNSRVAVPLPAVKAPQKPTAATQQPTPPATMPTQQPQSIADATQAATAAVAAAMAKLGPVNQTQTPPNQTSIPTSTDNLTQKVNQMRIQDQTRGRSRGRGGTPRGGRRESAQKNIDVPKEDFDFESANAKFNKQDLVKEAIASGSPPNGLNADAEVSAATNGQINGDSEKDITDEVVIPPAVTAVSATAEKGYDKKSSFFDNISSDLKDRVEAQQAKEEGGGGGFVDGRAMRNQERSKNFETFGQGSVDHSGGYRGGYRGRGRGRGYRDHRGGGYRGGRGGYDNRERGGGGYRGRGSGGKVTGEPTFV